MRRKELGKYCYMILISNLNVVVLRVECQRLDITGREVQQPSWQTVRASRCSPCWCGTCRCQPCRSLSSRAHEDIVEQELDNDDDGGGDGDSDGGDGESKGKSGDLFDQIFNLRIGGPILGLHVGGDQISHLLIKICRRSISIWFEFHQIQRHPQNYSYFVQREAWSSPLVPHLFSLYHKTHQLKNENCGLKKQPRQGASTSFLMGSQKGPLSLRDHEN